MLSVVDYGRAVGNGKQSDWSAFGRTFKECIESGVPLEIPPPPGGQYVLDGPVDVPPAAGQIGYTLDITAHYAYNQLAYRGPSGTPATLAPVFRFCGLKRSTVRGLSVEFPDDTTLDSVVALDLDFLPGAQPPVMSTAQLQFSQCHVNFGAKTTNSFFQQLGHSANADISQLLVETSEVSSAAAQNNNAGVRSESPNALGILYQNCRGARLSPWFSDRCGPDAAASPGGDTVTFVNQVNSDNVLDYDLANAGSVAIVGGRYESGQRFLQAGAGSAFLAISVDGTRLAGYTPSDGCLIALTMPTALRLASTMIHRAGQDYDARLIQASCAPGRFGSITLDGCAVQAPDPFHTLGAGTWQVRRPGTALINSARQPIKLLAA